MGWSVNVPMFDESGKTDIKKENHRVVYEITERTVNKFGQMLLFLDIEVNTWWSSLDLSYKEIIKLYDIHGSQRDEERHGRGAPTVGQI
jgi:hypothetical protein